MHTLKFCGNNLNDDMEKLVRKVENEFSNVAVSVEPCLGQCGDCAEQYFALADDNLIMADTTHLLFERIKNNIGEKEVAHSN